MVAEEDGPPPTAQIEISVVSAGLSQISSIATEPDWYHGRDLYPRLVELDEIETPSISDAISTMEVATTNPIEECATQIPDESITAIHNNSLGIVIPNDACASSGKTNSEIQAETTKTPDSEKRATPNPGATELDADAQSSNTNHSLQSQELSSLEEDIFVSIQPLPERRIVYPGAFDVTTPILIEEGGHPNAADNSGITDASDLPANDIEGVEVGLANATPIEDDHNSDLPRATLYEDDKQRRCSLTLAATAGVVLVILCAAAVVVILVSISNKSDDPGLLASPLDNNATVVPSLEYPLSILPTPAVEAIGADQTSPQALAYQWLLQDPSLSIYTSSRIIQRFSLATFFHSTNGQNWIRNTNWLSYDIHECDWFTQRSYSHTGTSVEGELLTYKTSETRKCNSRGDYEHLWLRINNLRGTLPEELFLITTLKSMDYGYNPKLAGSISTAIENLQQLETMVFTWTSLSGSLPTQIGLCQELYACIFYENSGFASTIPTQLGLLTKLEYLIGSNFEGTLPTQVGQMTELRWLELYHSWENPTVSHISGTIPSQLGLLSNSLKELWLGGNALSGQIPSELGLLQELLALEINHNILESTIPTEFGNLGQLRFVELHYNSGFHGTLPSQIGQLGSLTRLWLNGNDLSGSLPSELGLLSNLLDLLIENNQNLSGTLPPLSPTLVGLDVTSTRISGTIPSRLCEISNRASNFSSWTYECQFDSEGQGCDVLGFLCQPGYLCGCDCNCSSNRTGNDTT